MKLEKLIGQVLDSKYHLDKLLGQGGMGAVFLATHLGTKRPVALKVIAPQFMANEEVSERFRREAEAAGRLRHPNVVNVTDFGVTAFEREKLAYLVMEYLDGASLGEMMKQRGKLPLPMVVDIVEQTCLAIGTAHKLGIIHRDLKPDNILLQPDGRGGYIVKVLDFGLAKLRDVSEAVDEVNPISANTVDTTTRAIGNQTAHAPERTTADVKASTQFQQPDATELEAATQLQSPSEAEAATMMQSPASTVNEAATLLQTPKSPEIEAATLNQPATTLPEEQTRIMDAGSESATLIQPADAAFNGNASDEETATRIQTDAATQTEKHPSRPTAMNDVSVTTSASVELTRIGSILGTPLYMSPEQCRGETLDSHSDIYSLGVIVYQMLAGEPPFTGTMTELMTKHCDEAPPSLKEKRDDVPASVAELVNAALAKNPAERPASAEIFATALHATAETEIEVLQQAKANYYSAQRVFFLASMFLYLPCAFVSLAISIGLGDTLSSNPVAAIVFYIALFSLVLIATKWNAALSTLLLEKQRVSPNTPIPLKPVLKIFASRFVSLTGTIVQSYLHILWGFVRFIRPGARAAVNAALVASVAIMEGKRGGAALARSAALVRQLRLVALAFTLRDFGVCLWSLVLFPGITVLMTYIFGGTRTSATSLMLLPMIRNFIAGYSWVLLTMLHTVYAAVPLGLLYFKALQAKGESLASSGVRDWQSESRKKANQLSKATIAWIVLPLAMVLFMILSGVITSQLETSVIDAVRNGRLETVKQLLAKGKNPNDTNFSTSALMYAAKEGQAEMVKLLLANGANVKQVDNDGDDALIYAAIDNRVEAMKELIGAGADRNWQNKKGNTALLSAAQKGRTAAVQCLLAAGADPNLKNKDGKTALAVAEAEGHLETAQLLKAAGQ